MGSSRTPFVTEFAKTERGLYQMIVDEICKTRHVATLLGVQFGDGFEVLTYKSIDGVVYELDLVGSSLEGVGRFLVEASAYRTPVALPCYVEFGTEIPDRNSRRNSTGPYIEVLYTSELFGTLPDHRVCLEQLSAVDYADWLETHRVSPVICPDGLALYYGYASAIERTHAV